MGLFTIGFTLIVITGIITDMISKNKKLEIKRIEAEFKLEQQRAKTYELETKQMQLSLEQSKQLLLEKRKE